MNRDITDQVDRQPPRSLEAERGVLGSILMLPDECDKVATILRADDFYDPRHEKIFAQIISMHRDGGRIDVVLVAERLRSAGSYEMAGGAAYLADLLNSVATPAHATYYANIVREKSALRQAIHAATELLRDAFDDPQDVRSCLAQHAEKLERLLDSSSATHVVTGTEAIAGAVAKARSFLLADESPAVPTGFWRFDQTIGGMFAGELIVLAARPRVGKTSLASQVGFHNARAGRRVLFVSSEMSAVDVTLRELCAMASISQNDLRRGAARDGAAAAINDVAANLDDAAIVFDDRPRPSTAEIRAVARWLHREALLSLIVVDYLQRLKPRDDRRQRHEQVGEMAADLKTLARELGIPLLCLAQLNREADKTADGKPTLGHLRESGSIEAEADQIWLLHRPELHLPNDADLRGKAELTAAKNRNGIANETFQFLFDAPSTSFRESEDDGSDGRQTKPLDF